MENIIQNDNNAEDETTDEITDEIDEDISDSENENENSSDSDEEDTRKYKKKDKKRFLINMYGVTEKGRSISVYVKGFPTFFYLEIPQTWKKTQTIQFVDYLN